MMTRSPVASDLGRVVGLPIFSAMFADIFDALN
jgi:hypothetical protein